MRIICLLLTSNVGCGLVRTGNKIRADCLPDRVERDWVIVCDRSYGEIENSVGYIVG